MGRVTVSVIAVGLGITVLSFITMFQVRVPAARADDLQTSVTVLNTPPTWAGDGHAHESDALGNSLESSATNPTNAGNILAFSATAHDSSGDGYWLLICKNYGSSTPSVSGPSCPGGSANQWAISPKTASDVQAVAATTTIANFPFAAESNVWYAYICDDNATGPQCQNLTDQGTGNYASPFVINHPPYFTAISNNSPQNPNGTLTWTSTAVDTDTARTTDTVQLYVCKTQAFSTSTGCTGGAWAVSSLSAANPATSTTLTAPFQDGLYNAYVYVMDMKGLAATSSFQSLASNFTVNNVAPTIAAASISLINRNGATGTPMTLLTPGGLTTGYRLVFTVADNNGCQNKAAGAEDVLATTTIYRSGRTGLCKVASDWDQNMCYPSASAYTNISCSQDAGSCSGAGDSDSTWTCNYSLWSTSDPTDVGSKYPGENWLASVQAQDDNGLDSSFVESSSGTELNSFLAFDVSQTAIAYGGLQPGSFTATLQSPTSTTLLALGNTGLDENLYGDTMCKSWTAADSCDIGGADPTSKIPVTNQRFATTSGTAFASGTQLAASTSAVAVGIHVTKTIATTSVQSKDTFWGINIPSAITVAGNYQGQNTIVGVASNAAYW